MIVVRSRAWWRATLALCLGSLLVFLNLYVPQPLLPLLREAYGISTLAASLAMSVSTLALAASLLVFGPLSDAIGRAGIMRLTLMLAGLLSIALAFAPGFETLLILRAVQGFVLGGLPAVAIAWMGDEFDRPALLSAVGLYIGANTLGGIGGRVIGGSMAEIGGVSASFLTVGALTLVGVRCSGACCRRHGASSRAAFVCARRGPASPGTCAIPCCWGLSVGRAEFPDLHQPVQLHHLPPGGATLRAGRAVARATVSDLSQRYPGLDAVRSPLACDFPADVHGVRYSAADGGHGPDAFRSSVPDPGGADRQCLRFLSRPFDGFELGRAPCAA
ncbi:inner membrane transport protein YnfM [Halomonas elongata]|uniref:Inner membrane transport protein YnfM n=1 Tax=Halomonas elongata TaxID=2746 RepID=A0A1B8P0H1_HALEL|nr:inner membrane transport protein YnfM [Halomonas elongata]